MSELVLNFFEGKDDFEILELSFYFVNTVFWLFIVLIENSDQKFRTFYSLKDFYPKICVITNMLCLSLILIQREIFFPPNRDGN